MKANNRLDATRLLGFASSGDQVASAVDFRDDTLGAKLGAKVGGSEPGGQPDFSRLLGFASLGEQRSVDFRNEIFDSKLGAKIGTGESSWAAELLCPDKSSEHDAG